MKKILLSILTIGFISTVAAFGITRAFFSDTETSTGNILAAGQIDLTVSSTGTATEGSNCTFSSDAPGGPMFNCTDLKPGDSGKANLQFGLTTNPAWACVVVKNYVDKDNTCVDPEQDVVGGEGGACVDPDGNGELDDELLLTAWIDNGAGANSCNNIQDAGEQTLVTNAALSSFGGLGSGNLVLPVSDTTAQSMLGMGTPLQPGNYCVGVAWSVDPTADNKSQTDSVGGDLTFYVEQSRNNTQFSCNTKFGS